MNIGLNLEQPVATVAGLDPGGIWNAVQPIVGAVAIFLLGWIVASVVASFVGKVLRRSPVDSYLSSNVRGGSSISLWRIAKAVVFWLILLMSVVFALNVLNLTTASAPLNNFLNQIFSYLPRLGSAAVLALLAWVIATVAKMVVVKTANSWELDSKLDAATDSTATTSADGQNPDETPLSYSLNDMPMGSIPRSSTAHAEAGRKRRPSMSHTLGKVVSGFIFLLFLPLILDALGLQNSLPPVQNLINQFLSALPSIFKACVIAGAGWLIASLLRDFVSNLLVAVGSDRLTQRNGNNLQLSRMGGMVVFVLVLIPAAIAALDALALPAISTPASGMLNQVLSAVPLIATAGAILAGAFFVGRIIADVLTNLLDSVNFNGMFRLMGIEPPAAGGKTPSEIAGMVSLVGIMLFATVAATNILNIPALTAIVTNLMFILGRVLIGLVIFGVGLYLANLVYGLVSSSGSDQSKVLGQMARIAILVFVGAMALQQMGIGENIVNMAFGLTLGAIAVSMAIAFGLGGRDVAGKHLDRWLSSFNGLDKTPHPQQRNGDHPNGNSTSYGGVGNNPGQPLPRYNKPEE